MASAKIKADIKGDSVSLTNRLSRLSYGILCTGYGHHCNRVLRNDGWLRKKTDVGSISVSIFDQTGKTPTSAGQMDFHYLPSSRPIKPQLMPLVLRQC